MKYTFLPDVPRPEYDAFVSNHPGLNLLQTSAWAEVKTDWQHHLTGLVDKTGRLVAAALVLVRRLPLGQAIWYVPRGPVADILDFEVLEAYLLGLRDMAKAEGATFLNVDLPFVLRELWLEDFPGERDKVGDVLIKKMEALGFYHQGYPEDMTSTIQPRFSAITYAESDFQEKLPARTKRFIKQVQVRGVTISREPRTSLGDFAKLIAETEKRHGISLRSREYFEGIFQAYGDKAFLYLARINVEQVLNQVTTQLQELEAELEATPEHARKKRQNLEIQRESYRLQQTFLHERLQTGSAEQVVAGLLGVDYGLGFDILYAGRNDDYHKIPAQDALFATAMNDAFLRGAKLVSSGGVSGTLDDGLTRFKAGLLAKFSESIGEFHWVNHTLWYRFVRLGLKLRQKLVHRK